MLNRSTSHVSTAPDLTRNTTCKTRQELLHEAIGIVVVLRSRTSEVSIFVLLLFTQRLRGDGFTYVICQVVLQDPAGIKAFHVMTCAGEGSKDTYSRLAWFLALAVAGTRCNKS